MSEAGQYNLGYLPDDAATAEENGNSVFQLKNADTKDKEETKEPKIPEPVSPELKLDNCGLPCCSLPALNWFRNPKWFLFFLSLASFLQGMVVNGLVNVVITTIERRFKLQSSQTGIIVSSYDIGSLLVVIPISYLGGRLGASKPRWIGYGLFVMGLGSFLYSIPHFATPPYESRMDEADNTELCGEQLNDDQCDDEGNTGLSTYRFVFVLGQLLHGFGAAPLVILGTTFLDENVDKKLSPLYIAIFQTFFVFGPAVGYILGGQFLSLHTDLVTVPGLTTTSALWVGAWWPGFLASAFLSGLCGLFILFYPPSLTTETRDAKPEKDMGKLSFSELPRYLSDLVSNPTYLFICIGQSLDGFAVSGCASFLPKVLEHEFSLAGGTAAQIVGMIVVPAGGGGTFLGGLFIKKWKLNRSRILLMCLISQILSIIPALIANVFYCEAAPFVGVSYFKPKTEEKTYFPVPQENFSSPLLSSCNADCGCNTAHVDPVCGADGLMYMSPCVAGCSGLEEGGNYTGCSCVNHGGNFVTMEKCKTECNYLLPICIIVFFNILFTFLSSMPSIVATLRAILPEQRSVGLGIQSIINRLLGSIPGPTFFGFMVDRVCVLWDSTCDESSSCILYNNKHLLWTMMGVVITMKILSAAFYSLSYVASNRSKIKDEVEDKVIVVEPVSSTN